MTLLWSLAIKTDFHCLHLAQLIVRVKPGQNKTTAKKKKLEYCAANVKIIKMVFCGFTCKAFRLPKQPTDNWQQHQQQQQQLATVGNWLENAWVVTRRRCFSSEWVLYSQNEPSRPKSCSCIKIVKIIRQALCVTTRLRSLPWACADVEI